MTCKRLNSRYAHCLFFAILLGLTARSAHGADYVVVLADQEATLVREGYEGKQVYEAQDANAAIAWAMEHHDLVVIGPGEYQLSEPVSIPRDGVRLVVDEGASLNLNVDALPATTERPYYPRVPVIYNPGHDHVTVINLGDLVGQARKRGAGIFYDGRSGGELGIRGGTIVHAGMVGQNLTTAGSRPTVNMAVSLVDCEGLDLPLVFGDGYRIDTAELEGCKDVTFGLVAKAPRAGKSIHLVGLNEGTHIEKLVVTHPSDTGIYVQNSPGTILDEGVFVGDPLAGVLVFHPHPYGPSNVRFTQRPVVPDSEGSILKSSTLNPKRVVSWNKDVQAINFPASLPQVKAKVFLEAEFEDQSKEVLIDKVYDLQLTAATEDEPPYIVVSPDDSMVRATHGKTGEVLYEDPDAATVLTWSLLHAPITVIDRGALTVSGMFDIPRDNVSLVIAPGGELRQDPEITPPEMPNGRGGFRALIHNPGRDNVNVVVLGTLRPYKGLRGGGVNFDGSEDTSMLRADFDQTGREGNLNVKGGMIFAAGSIYADDVVWVIDSEAVSIPLVLADVYTNAPLAVEGSEDLTIGTVAALAGDLAFENEAIDFNGYCKRVAVEKVIGTTPAEEVVDVNNSQDCVVDEVRVYRSMHDVEAMRVDDWPDRQNRSPKLMSERPLIAHSSGSICNKTTMIDHRVSSWRKRVTVVPLVQTLPRVELQIELTALFEDGSEQTIVDENLAWDLKESN